MEAGFSDALLPLPVKPGRQYSRRESLAQVRHHFHKPGPHGLPRRLRFQSASPGRSHVPEELRYFLLKPLGNFFDVDERYISNASLNSTVISPVQSTSFRSFLLTDPLLLPYATNRSPKTDADVEWHWPPSWALVADRYTAYESHCS